LAVTVEDLMRMRVMPGMDMVVIHMLVIHTEPTSTAHIHTLRISQPDRAFFH